MRPRSRIGLASWWNAIPAHVCAGRPVIICMHSSSGVSVCVLASEEGSAHSDAVFVRRNSCRLHCCSVRRKISPRRRRRQGQQEWTVVLVSAAVVACGTSWLPRGVIMSWNSLSLSCRWRAALLPPREEEGAGFFVYVRGTRRSGDCAKQVWGRGKMEVEGEDEKEEEGATRLCVWTASSRYDEALCQECSFAVFHIHLWFLFSPNYNCFFFFFFLCWHGCWVDVLVRLGFFLWFPFLFSFSFDFFSLWLSSLFLKVCCPSRNVCVRNCCVSSTCCPSVRPGGLLKEGKRNKKWKSVLSVVVLVEVVIVVVCGVIMCTVATEFGFQLFFFTFLFFLRKLCKSRMGKEPL